jgi:hypothetical protein
LVHAQSIELRAYLIHAQSVELRTYLVTAQSIVFHRLPYQMTWEGDVNVKALVKEKWQKLAAGF